MPSKTNRTKTLPPSKRLSKGELAVAIRKIERRIAELKSFDISKVMRVHDGRADALHEKVHASLSEIFGEGTAEYARYAVPSPSWPLSLSLPEGQSPDSVKYIQATYREHIADMTSRLESLLESLSERREVQEILNERPELQVEQPKSLAGEPHPPIGKRVFVVHGHDEEAKQTVARFLEKLNLEPIILSEQPNKGQTIIEKFEASANVSFAVVLLTPDDVGRSRESTDLRSRARQNVILELGYFIGRLSRARVCALYKGSTEVPSDIHGIVYVAMDDAGGWKLSLASELKEAGLPVDLNLVV